jgi:hypothetical protein
MAQRIRLKATLVRYGELISVCWVRTEGSGPELSFVFSFLYINRQAGFSLSSPFSRSDREWIDVYSQAVYYALSCDLDIESVYFIRI